MEQESLLTDLEFNPVLASSGKRFLNYLIDVIIFDIVIAYIRIGFFYSSSSVYTYGNTSYLLIRTLITFIFWVVFYFLSETIFKGRTIGKFITGTKAVNEDGTEMEPKIVMLRSLSRIVPFEPFSALGNPPRPWHDKWTRTYVIDIRQTALNNPSVL